MSILMQLETPTLVTRPDGSTKTYKAGLVYMEESDVMLYLNQQLEVRSKMQNTQPVKAAPVAAETKQEKK